MTDIIDNLISGVSLVKAINEETKKHDESSNVKINKEQEKQEKQNIKLKQIGALGSALGNILGGNYVMAGSMLVRFRSSVAEEQLKTNRRNNKWQKKRK